MKKTMVITTIVLFVAGIGEAADVGAEWSGVYPHLAWFNTGNECGTGAVVPWADRLWVITYSPHKPLGSDDKLYEIDDDRLMDHVDRHL